MACICNVGVDNFKAFFVRDFPYLPLYQDFKAYFKGDIVYNELNFYQSLIDGNETQPPAKDWQLYNDNVNNYISDDDILRAFTEAKVNFNANLFPDDETAIMIFCYLAAHYLVIDMNNALNPFGMGFNGFTQSKSVGSVSESYGIPQWMMNDKILGMYAQTGYGRKYLSLIAPYMIGNIIYTPGMVNFG